MEVPKLILIVEDSPVQAETLKRIMAEQGYDIAMASSGAEGLDAIRKKKPDLIISDIMMPVMDGYQMCWKIKESQELNKIPVLLLTQLTEPEEVIRGLESGADNYLTKPFNKDFLLTKVKTLLENPEGFKNRPDRKSVEFEYAGKRYEVHSGRAQTLGYLISTYENAVLKTKELEKAHEELRVLNENLEMKVDERTSELKKSNDALQVEVAERKKAEETIRVMACFDPLTGLPNKTRLYQIFSETIKESGLRKESFALLMLDLDGFRDINDVLGFNRGDELLKGVGSRIGGLFKGKETLARYGADEFAVLMPATDLERAIRFAKEVIGIMDEPFEISATKLYVQINIGITLFPGHGSDPELLVRRAEVAMLQAKGKGDGYSVYAGQFEKGISKRLTLAGDLRHAIENNQLLLYCQPKVEIRSGKISGAEALLRWKHPGKGMIPPCDFIPIAESTGLIRPLTYWVLEATARQCFAWQKENIETPLSINLSVRNLHDIRLLDKIGSLISTWGIRPGSFEVELTESAFTDEPAVYGVLTHIKDMGINISIDDFGTGYSSLSYLQRLPVNAVKIDKSFVSGMRKDKNSASIVNATIALAHNMNLKVVAEGVEERETYEMLSGCGCNEVQGYYVSEPMPADQFSNWLKKCSWKSNIAG